MIEVDNLHKSYGRFVALHGISFEVPSGAIAGFLGPNGAGKTTAMRILTTFLPADGGTAKVAGIDVAKAPAEVCARLGYLPESMPIHPELRVGEYLAYRAALKGIPRARVRQRLGAVIDECGIAAVSRKLLGALSKGYRQRVGLADALLADPEVLILDEPTSGLDPRQVAEVRRMIEGFRGRRTVLLSSHILGEVEQVCDQIIIVDDGRVRALETRESWGERIRAGSRLEVLLVDPPATVAESLGAIEGVLEVEREGDLFRLRTRGDRRLAVSEVIRAERWKLLEFRPVRATLESLFLEVTGRKAQESGSSATEEAA